jgi:hypothetical protein
MKLSNLATNNHFIENKLVQEQPRRNDKYEVIGKNELY